MVRRTRSKKPQRTNKRNTRGRKQYGGNRDIISVKSWIDKVKLHPAYTKVDTKYQHLDTREQVSFRLGEYTMNDLKDLSLKLPNRPEGSTSVEVQWDVNNDSGATAPKLDIRSLAATLYDKWNPFFGVTPSPTPSEFKEYITTNMSDDPEIADQDPDFRIAANFLMESENKLRRIGYVDTIERLTEGEKYPLFVWFLMMNQPDKPEKSAPAFIPKAAANVEMAEEGNVQMAEEGNVQMAEEGAVQITEPAPASPTK